eukprot:718099-Amphidinium_carterae.2
MTSLASCVWVAIVIGSLILFVVMKRGSQRVLTTRGGGRRWFPSCCNEQCALAGAGGCCVRFAALDQHLCPLAPCCACRSSGGG